MSLSVGALELVFGLLVLRQLARFGRAFPWLAGLMAFFVLRGLDRTYLAFSTSGSYGIDIMLDGLLLVVVFLLAAGLDKTVRTLRAAEDAAQHQRNEYERALRDYRRLARHRLANPLAAIHGSIATLRDLEGLDQKTRSTLLATVEEQVQRLEEVVLEPVALRPEERFLQPRPDVPDPRLAAGAGTRPPVPLVLDHSSNPNANSARTLSSRTGIGKSERNRSG